MTSFSCGSFAGGALYGIPVNGFTMFFSAYLACMAIDGPDRRKVTEIGVGLGSTCGALLVSSLSYGSTFGAGIRLTSHVASLVMGSLTGLVHSKFKVTEQNLQRGLPAHSPPKVRKWALLGPLTGIGIDLIGSCLGHDLVGQVAGTLGAFAISSFAFDV